MQTNYIDPAAASFKEAMFSNLIGENFSLDFFSYHIESEEEFLSLTNNRQRFTNFIAEKISKISSKTEFDLSSCYMELFKSGFLGAYGLALWFLHFDEDNWFSYNRVYEQTNNYLNSETNMAERLELRLFKGFQNRGIWTTACSVLDLPVVVNYGAKSITLWRCELND